MFGDIRHSRYWGWVWSNDYEPTKFEFGLVYIIVVIFSIKGGYKLLHDVLNLIQGDFDAHLKCA